MAIIIHLAVAREDGSKNYGGWACFLDYGSYSRVLHKQMKEMNGNGHYPDYHFDFEKFELMQLQDSLSIKAAYRCVWALCPDWSMVLAFCLILEESTFIVSEKTARQKCKSNGVYVCSSSLKL